MSERAEILTLQPSVALASWQRAFIGIWRGRPTVPAAEEVGRQYRRMMGNCPDGFGVLFIIEEHIPMPDEPTRRAIAAAMESVGSAILGMAGVQEGTGFRGAAIRSVLTALNAMTSAPYPRKLAATVAEAAAWLSPILSHNTKKLVRATDLRDVVAELRETIADRQVMSELRTTA